MARDVAISIGVQKAGDLVLLPGALTGAREFAEWARGADFDKVIELTDADGASVDADVIRDTVMAEVDVGDVARMFIFFAGHGVSLGVGADYWLLSPSIQDDETDGAVNVVASLHRARRCGLDHLAVFADHCRTMAGKPQQGVYGRPIFSDRDIAKATEIDEFYAAQPGDVSQEAQDLGRERAFGVFTGVLLEALNGEADQAAVPVPNGLPRRAVTAKSLRDWIVDAVQDAAEDIPEAVVQIPDPRPGSYLPNVLAWLQDSGGARLRIEVNPNGPSPDTIRVFVANSADDALTLRIESRGPLELDNLAIGAFVRIEVDGPLTHRQDPQSSAVFRLESDREVEVGLVEDTTRAELQPGQPDATLLRSLVIEPDGRERSRASGAGLHEVVTRDELTGRSISGYQMLGAGETPAPVGSIAAETAVEADVEALARTRGREGFETRVGLSVIGAMPDRVAVSPGYDELFEENGLWHVRGIATGSAVIHVGDERYAAVAMLDGFVGSVVVDGTGVAHVAYEPARGSDFDEGAVDSAEARHAMALATVAARRGRFDVIVDDAMDVAGTLRRYKHYNPAFGILAAYAYDLAGRRDQVEGLVEYFVRYPQPVPYDVVMLAGVDSADLPVPVAPSFPMLTQGWAYLDTKGLPEPIAAARRSLAPTLWATPTGEGGAALFAAVERGDL